MKIKDTRFVPKRQLGQNFLIDPNILRKIVAACDLRPTDTVLEIGAGLGVLTRELSKHVKKVFAIETDQKLCSSLAEQFNHSNVDIIHADFLKYSFNTLPAPLKVVGNLPYYISTPIIEKILRHREKFITLYITIQWELGLRMTAQINHRDYSSLSCYLQYYSDPKILFKIKNTCFRPVPKVDSCFMELKIRSKPLYKVDNEELLFKLIRFAFQKRRKTITNALDVLIERKKLKGILEVLHIDGKLRAENLSLKNYAELTETIDKLKPEGRGRFLKEERSG